MADMKRIKGRIAETIYPNGTGAITAESHQALLLEMVDTINREKADQSELVATQESLDALADRVDNLPQGGGDVKADGVYPDLTAGDLAGRGESVPAEFGFRASGGKSIKDGRAYIKRIKGNSVVWNQLIRGTLSSSGNATITNDGDDWIITPDGENVYPGIRQDNFIVAKGCKYLVVYETLFEGVLSVGINMRGQSEEKNLTSGGSWISDQRIIELNTVNNNYAIILFFKNAKSEIKVRNFIVIDLTKMFGAGNEPTTIEEFNARVATLGVDINAYNEGQVIHCNTESIKSVGDNAWDEQWEVGAIDWVGQNSSRDNTIRCKNFIPCIPNTTYYVGVPSASDPIQFFYYDDKQRYISYEQKSKKNQTFTTPTNARCMRFFVYGSAYGSVYKNDILISLYHSGWKAEVDGGYKPYWQDTLPLPIISKYFRDGMKSAGTPHDEIYYDKMQNKKFAVQRVKAVKMKDLYWSLYTASNNNTSFVASLQGIRQPSTNAERIDGALIAKYSPTTENQNTGSLVDKCWVRETNNIYIKDDAFASAEAFVNSLNDNDVIYYELAEPIVTELDAEDQNFRDYYNVADFGTEMSQSLVPSAPFSADIIYQFNAVDMIREHELEITELQNIIATMQAQLTSLINGGQ